MVGSGTRNARAISGVVSPVRVRSVRATRPSGGRAGWQQVKISRSRSSEMSPSGAADGPGSGASIRACCSLAASLARRRSTSMARLRAAVGSQAPGRSGIPSRSQTLRARVKASWAHSSARSQSPVIAISDAVIRPHSSRNTASTATSAALAAGTVSPPRLPVRIKLPDVSIQPPAVRRRGERRSQTDRRDEGKRSCTSCPNWRGRSAMTSAAPRSTTGCAPRRMLPLVTAPGAASSGSRACASACPRRCCAAPPGSPRRTEMKYLNFVAASGRPAREDLTVMQREIPGWEKETQGVRLLGRPLDLPHTARTVRVRDSQPLVTDGPFVEAKEFIAGFDLLECADLDECIALAATAPVARFMAVEIRPFASEPRLDEKAASFGRFQDGAARPYALGAWAGGTQAPPSVDQAVLAEGDAWRQEAAARGLHLLGGAP